jgi:HMG (high mobility group) box
LGKLVGTAWKNLDDKEKEHYRQMVKFDKLRYEEESSAYQKKRNCIDSSDPDADRKEPPNHQDPLIENPQCQVANATQFVAYEIFESLGLVRAFLSDQSLTIWIKKVATQV